MFTVAFISLVGCLIVGIEPIEVTVRYEGGSSDRMFFRTTDRSICPRYSSSLVTANSTHVTCQCSHGELFYTGDLSQPPRCQDENFGKTVGCDCLDARSCSNYMGTTYIFASWQTKDLDCGSLARTGIAKYSAHTGEWLPWTHNSDLNYFVQAPLQFVRDLWLVNLLWQNRFTGVPPLIYEKYEGRLMQFTMLCGTVPKGCSITKGLGSRVYTIADATDEITTEATTNSPPGSPTATIEVFTAATMAPPTPSLVKTKPTSETKTATTTTTSITDETKATTIRNPNPSTSESNASMSMMLIIAIVSLVFIILVLLTLVFICWRKRKASEKKSKGDSTRTLQQRQPPPRIPSAGHNIPNNIIALPAIIPLSQTDGSDQPPHYEELMPQEPFVPGYLQPIDADYQGLNFQPPVLHMGYEVQNEYA